MVPGFGKIIRDADLLANLVLNTLDILHYNITVWQITITIVDNNERIVLTRVCLLD